MTRQDPSNGLPLQRVNNVKYAGLPQYLGSVFYYYVIQGDVLSVVPNTTGSIAFNVSVWAKTLADLPESPECEALFLQELCNLVSVPVQEVNT